MYRGVTVGVVVPCYDEANHVGEVLETLPGFVDRVYAVDDGSTDATWRVLREHADLRLEPADPRRPCVGAVRRGATPYTTLEGYESAPPGEPPGEHSRVVAVRHPENRGVGAAIKTGYRLARADGVAVTTVISGDGQMDPDYLDRFIDPLVDGRADYAKGTRLSRPDHHAGMPPWRRFGTRLLTVLTRVSTGYWNLEDSQNGYAAISLSALESIRIDDLYDGYGFANDLLAALSRRGMRVVDVPHPARYGDEDSTIRYRSFVPALSWLLLANFLARLRHTARTNPFDPAVVGYSLGLAGVAFSGGAAAGAILGRLLGTHAPVWAIPVALVIAGAGVLAGLVADVRGGTGAGGVPHGPSNVGEGGDR